MLEALTGRELLNLKDLTKVIAIFIKYFSFIRYNFI